MRKLLSPLYVVLAMLTSGAAYSADLAGKPAAAPAAPVVAETTLSAPFSGLYVGAMLGHAAGTLNDAEGFRIPKEGYTGSLIMGYNHRLGLQGIVVGLEGDIGMTDMSGSTNAGGFTVSGSNKAAGSLRARIGVIPLHGHTLVYATGGAALTNNKLAIDGIGSQEKNTKGYVLGGGIESMLFGNMGVRVEVLRTQWLDQGFTLGGSDTGKLGSHETAVRAGLIFKMN